MCRPLPSTAERQVEARLLGPDGVQSHVFDMPDEVTALRFIDLLRATSYCRAARLMPTKERRCDLGAACTCAKAGWKGECIAAPHHLTTAPDVVKVAA